MTNKIILTPMMKITKRAQQLTKKNCKNINHFHNQNKKLSTPDGNNWHEVSSWVMFWSSILCIPSVYS